MTDATLLSLAEAIDALASPYAFERYSHLTGENMLVVDFRRSAAVPNLAAAPNSAAALDPAAALDSAAALRAKIQL
ncbi:MAG: hypothetical protein JRG94_26955 [Deltaproteobacteria bacterium]|nr:hypothetical protein [Deltaproteobacteria bacterium]